MAVLGAVTALVVGSVAALGALACARRGAAALRRVPVPVSEGTRRHPRR
jgi:hypothetical protein